MQPNSMQPTAAPSAPVTPMAAPKQKNMGLIAGMVMSILLGIGGISFGVYGMINASNKTTDISDLNIQYTTKEGESVKIDTDKVEISDDKKTIKIDESNVKKTNPIVSNYGVNFQTNYYVEDPADANHQLNQIQVSLENGVITSCSIDKVINKYYSEIDVFKNDITYLKDCKINGISGKIYKIAMLGEGQDGSDTSLAFILEDGTVDYLPLDNTFVNSSEETVKGKVKINGFVTDIFGVGVKQEIGGYYSTVFVLSDGSVIKYDKATMLQ